MPGVDFDRVRDLVTMEQVLNLLRFRSLESLGGAMVRKLSPARRRGWPSASLVLGERGDRSLHLPSLRKSWQSA